MLAKSSVEARASRQRYATGNGDGSWVTSYFGVEAALDRSLPPPPLDVLHPMAFIVEQDPGTEIKAHFHRAHQFQVFVAGSGAIGGTRLDGATVHYASAYTPYGPIAADAEGVSYLTLRNGWDPGPQFVHEYAEELRKSRRRRQQRTSSVVQIADEAATSRLSGLKRVEVFAEEGDGLAAWLFRVPAGATLEGPAPQGGGGQYWVVMSGAIDFRGACLPRLSCVFAAPNDHSIRLVSKGAEVLGLQFPKWPAGTELK